MSFCLSISFLFFCDAFLADLLNEGDPGRASTSIPVRNCPVLKIGAPVTFFRRCLRGAAGKRISGKGKQSRRGSGKKGERGRLGSGSTRARRALRSFFSCVCVRARRPPAPFRLHFFYLSPFSFYLNLLHPCLLRQVWIGVGVVCFAVGAVVGAAVPVL